MSHICSSGVCFITFDDVCSDNSEGRIGQCPYLVPAVSQSCDLQCTSDSHCEQDEKCCSNGCGLHCAKPIVKTGQCPPSL